MDIPEITWRMRSLLRDQADAIRIPLGLVPKLASHNIPATSEFRPGFRCSTMTNEDWKKLRSDNKDVWLRRLKDKADLILENKLSYFDLEEVDHGNPFNWHRDFSAGIDAPIKLSVRTNYRDFKTNGDCKLVWEPNRHHQLVVLSRAYVATNDRKYAIKVAELLRSWIDANPFGYGMNWKSPLELGVRLINWVWAIDLIRYANVMDDALWQDICQCVYLAIWDCERKFSKGSSANNHLIGEAAGIFIACCYFNTFPHAKKWRESSSKVLEQEIIAQTYPDGCTEEHAFGYQFFVMQFFLLSLRAGNATGNRFSTEYRDRLKKMYRFMDEISADTGTPPNMGDSDNGYVLDLGDLPRNTCELLTVGGHEFGITSLLSGIRSETVFWLFGDVPRENEIEDKRRKSKLFSDSGYALLRTDRLSVFFDCAEIGYGRIAAHGHADCLSFCLSVDGRPVIVDPGTYDYFTSPGWRDHFRQTKAHNTVEIDAVSQSENLGPFMWGQRARPSKIDFHDNEYESFACASHSGYEKLRDPVTHHRSIALNKKSHTCTILDRFECRGKHEILIFFHLDTTFRIEKSTSSTIIIKSPDHELILSGDASTAQICVANNLEFTSWISNGYHDRKPSTSIVLRLTTNGNTSHRTTIVVSQ